MTDIEAAETGTPFAQPERRTFEHLAEQGFTTRAVTPEDAELWLKMGQLRATVYLGEGFIGDDEIDENGAEFDLDDDRSEHFVAIDDQNEVIGTVRVISKQEGGPNLPAEDFFDDKLPDDAREISRFMKHPDLRGQAGAVVSLSLMRAALKATRGRSDTIYAVLEPDLHRYLGEKIGIHLKTIGSPKYIEKYRTINHLVEMEPKLITSQILEKDHTRNPRVLGERLAPFFERNSLTQGLGRVALSDLSSPNPEQYVRNEGFMSRAEQETLWKSTVAIAGAGGDGGELAIALARLGVRNFRIADPENFSIENLNRQAGSSLGTIGHNKAEVIARELRALDAHVEVFSGGVTKDNVKEFMLGSDLVIDETEFTMPELGVRIAQVAREQKLPVLMTLNVGFGSYTTSFAHDGITFEEYLGLQTGVDPESIATNKPEVAIGDWLPHVPSYGSTKILAKVQRGEISAPTVVSGVHFAAGDASTQAFAHLVSNINPERAKWIRWAPTGRSVDAIDGSRDVKNRRLHFKLSVLRAHINTRRGKNQPNLEA